MAHFSNEKSVELSKIKIKLQAKTKNDTNIAIANSICNTCLYSYVCACNK